MSFFRLPTSKSNPESSPASNSIQQCETAESNIAKICGARFITGGSIGSRREIMLKFYYAHPSQRHETYYENKLDSHSDIAIISYEKSAVLGMTFQQAKEVAMKRTESMTQLPVLSAAEKVADIKADEIYMAGVDQRYRQMQDAHDEKLFSSRPYR